MDDHEMMGDMLDTIDRHVYGKYRGIVQDNNDPARRGRIKVLVPSIMGDQAVWALPCVPYAGENAGNYMIPEPDSGVWIEFEAGDPSYPVWVGCFWGDEQIPKNDQGNRAEPPLKIIRSKKGLMVSLDDQQELITVSDKDSKNQLTIEVRAGKIFIKGAVKAIVEAPQIELVEDASHPIVFGDKLLQYLNRLVTLYQTHTHFPLLSPPTPPFPPATPDLISTRVKSG